MSEFHAFSQEVPGMRTPVPISIIVHHPTTLDGKTELAKRTSEVHAQAVICRIKGLNCPTQQKLALLDAVIHTVTKNSREQI